MLADILENGGGNKMWLQSFYKHNKVGKVRFTNFNALLSGTPV